MFRTGNPFSFSQTFTNNGTIWSYGPMAAIIGSPNFGPITNNGLMVAEATSGGAVAIDVWSSFRGLTNSGSIYAFAIDGQAVGTSDYSSVDIFNSGLIAARSEQASAIAVKRYNGGPVHNAAGGQILAEGYLGAVGIALGRGQFWAEGLPVAASIDNAGLIQAVSLNPTRASCAATRSARSCFGRCSSPNPTLSATESHGSRRGS